MEQINKQPAGIVFFLKIFAFAYALTMGCLMLLALILYKFRGGELVVNVGVILIYILVCFISGFITGKRMEKRKFVWGFIVGMGYFAILALLSIVLKGTVEQLGESFISTMFLCAGSGMLGGMLS